MDDFITPFLEVLPRDASVTPLTAAELDALRTPQLPPALLDFYSRVGVGSFGAGLVFVLPPPVLQPMLDVWIPSSPKRIPFARTAFGDLFYYRDLADEAREKGMTGERPGELGDVSWVDVHYGVIEVLALSIEAFFGDVLAEPSNVAGVLRGPLAHAAQEIHGPLDAAHQLAFVPALALGGSEDLASVTRVDMLVHTSILRQSTRA